MKHIRSQLESLPDAELIAVVAERVMGWHLEEHRTSKFNGNVKKFWTRVDGSPVHLESFWSPATSWDAMGEVLLRLRELGFRFTIRTCKFPDNGSPDYSGKNWAVEIWNGKIESGSIGPNCPRAVAIAAVLAVQELNHVRT
jgi:hypothetical protein